MCIQASPSSLLKHCAFLLSVQPETKLTIPIIPVGIVAHAFTVLWNNLYPNSCFPHFFKSVLGRKIFFCPISDEVQPDNSVAFLHEVVFFIDRPSCLARATARLLWRVSEKKYSTKPRKSQAFTWGLGTNTLPSIF